mmetsp:Transcript_22012/g.50218  ORF Transcript_22012/g.50218 Transcript_22012/m.50218 type:complete len:405 (-) Transcript_22012:386-1600(-)
MTVLGNERKTPFLCILLPHLFHATVGFVQNPIRTHPVAFFPRWRLSARDDGKASSPSSDGGVHVYDGVFSPFACEELHYLAMDHCDRVGSDGSSIFYRPPHNTTSLSPLERALDCALSSLEGPASSSAAAVEYWSRQEHANIDAHADVDEAELEEEESLRCPRFGHVLYLQVDASAARGPTCVFPTKRGGWDAAVTGEPKVEMVVVPAVPGRILRFPGSVVHAVPRPADRWLRAAAEDKERGGDEEDGEEDFDERSVVLFNTWPYDCPPRGVDGDYATGALPDGIELPADADVEGFFASQKKQRFAEWEEDYGADAALLHANPSSEWVEQDFIQVGGSIVDDHDSGLRVESASEVGEVKVGLMGEKNRRIHPTSISQLYGPVVALKQALQEETAVTSILLQENK